MRYNLASEHIYQQENWNQTQRGMSPRLWVV